VHLTNEAVSAGIVYVDSLKMASYKKIGKSAHQKRVLLAQSGGLIDP
jgi:hypothetical protein